MASRPADLCRCGGAGGNGDCSVFGISSTGCNEKAEGG